MKKAEQPKEKMQSGFYVIVDGKQYGPFLEKHRSEFDDLKHRKGVEFTPTRCKGGWVEPPKKEKKAKPQSGLLFDTAPYSVNQRGRSKGWL